MGKIYKQNCKECSTPYKGVGKFWCSRICAVKGKSRVSKDGKQKYCGKCSSLKDITEFKHRSDKNILRPECAKCTSKRTGAYHRAHPEWSKEARKREAKKLRFEVLAHYSNGEMCCACCGESTHQFLAIDHVNNNGKQERESLKSFGYTFYRWLRKNKFPQNGYQVLCHNCNMAKGFYGSCPHKK